MRTEIAGRLQSEDPVTLNSYGVDSCGFYSLRFRVHDRSGAPVSSSVSGCWGQVLFLASAEQRGHLNNVDTHNRGHPSSRIGSPLRAPIFKMLGVHCQTYSGPQFPNDAGHPLSNPPLSKSLEKTDKSVSPATAQRRNSVPIKALEPVASAGRRPRATARRARVSPGAASA